MPLQTATSKHRIMRQILLFGLLFASLVVIGPGPVAAWQTADLIVTVSIDPSTAPNNAGTPVTIRGSGYTDQTVVEMIDDRGGRRLSRLDFRQSHGDFRCRALGSAARQLEPLFV